MILIIFSILFVDEILVSKQNSTECDTAFQLSVSNKDGNRVMWVKTFYKGYPVKDVINPFRHQCSSECDTGAHEVNWERIQTCFLFPQLSLMQFLCCIGHAGFPQTITSFLKAKKYGHAFVNVKRENMHSLNGRA